MPIWITLFCFIVFGILLNKTVYGRNTLAIGGNPEASRLAGISVERTRVWIFTVEGAVAALAGVILASRITSGQPNSAQGFELNVISACVLGGVSLMGGRATISGVRNLSISEASFWSRKKLPPRENDKVEGSAFSATHLRIRQELFEPIHR